jgi:hypothetical protein
MKKIIALLCSVLSLSAHAQYFNHDYGTSMFSDGAFNGHNTIHNGPGFTMAGVMQSNIATTPPASIVLFADQAGSVAPPYWINAYSFSGPLVPIETEVMELNANSFGVAGTVYDPGSLNTYIYYMELSATGAVINSSLYLAPGYSAYTLHSITSPTANEVYITGSALNAPFDYAIFAMRLTNTGAIVWANVYDMAPGVNIESGIDIIKLTGNDLVVVGVSDLNNGTDDGFVLQLNAATGAPVANGYNIYGTTTDAETFTCVNESVDPFGMPGYIVGGFANVTSPCANEDGWLMRLDGSYTQIWSNTYDYNASCVPNDFWDVTERQDSLGDYYYYAGGTTNSGLIGLGDMTVNKVKVNGGNTVAQYTYGTAGEWETLQSIDKNINGGSASGKSLGLSLFGGRTNGSVGGVDMTIYKTYFNGVTACDYVLGNGNDLPGPNLLATYTMLTYVPFFNLGCGITVSPISDQLVCMQATVPGGDNRSPGLATVNMLLNVLDDHSGHLRLDIQNATTGNCFVEVYDMFGRLVTQKIEMLGEGSNTLRLSMDNASGIYTVRVTQGDNSCSSKVLMTK